MITNINSLPINSTRIHRVLLIMSFSPPYEEYSDKEYPTPHVWDTPQSKQVVIFGFDWQDLMLKALVEVSPELVCEVWQPDLNADKEYWATLQKGLVHRNFPAKRIKRIKRGKSVWEMYSSSILERVKKEDAPDTLFILPVNYLEKWGKDIIISVKCNPILYCNFLNARLMLPNPIYMRNPLKMANRLLINREKKTWLSRVKHLLIGISNPEAAEKLREMYPQMEMHSLRLGFDENYWKQVVEKDEARRLLGIPLEDYVIVLSQRLVPVYQVDRFVEALSRVAVSKPFTCYVTGHGTRDYERYLAQKIKECNMEQAVSLVGRVPDHELRLYFIAADLFVAVPLVFGGSNGAVKCMALEKPIFHVESGFSYEFLKEHRAGVFVASTDYNGWTAALEDVINGKEIAVVPRKTVVDRFSWKAAGQELHNAIRQIEGTTR
ncbi:MAG: glycosyltransferase [Candidatus Cloacimonetes bacterium]|nr:glycosyltransferase [Candidatus Cloacimonadota bacterium]